MAIRETAIGFIPKIGDGIAWATEHIIRFVSTYGVNITPLQSKIFLFLIFGACVWGSIKVLSVANKILKWVLILASIFLTITIALSFIPL